MDPKGNIAVGDTGSDLIDIFRPWHTKPSRRIHVKSVPTQIALGNLGRTLFISNWVTNEVYSMDYPEGRPYERIQDPSIL